jgi:DNA polymerase/3'-5' exonuclease PolX
MSKTYSLKGSFSREVAEAVADRLVSLLPDTEVVGSLRRRCAVVGDIDLLTNSHIAMQAFPDVVDEVFVRGKAKVSGRKGEIQVDLNFTTEAAMGAALLHHTGSAAFNVFTRSRAKQRGYMLSQHGLFKGIELIAAASEEEVLALLDMLKYLDPTTRSR